MEKDFENLSEEEKKAMYEQWVKTQEQSKESQEKKKPIKQFFIPLGANYNAKLVLWDSSLQIVKSKKTGDTWEDYDKINLSKRLLIELMSRIPSFVCELEAREKTGEKEE